MHLELSGGLGKRGLTDAIRAAIKDGRLSSGVRLPSTRQLASDLGLARGTVTDAYQQLVAEGYLRARQGAPTTVATWRRPAAPQRPAPQRRSPQRSARWNLLPGRPDASAFPRAQWLSATRRALAGMRAEDFDYGAAAGHPRLRAALAEYVGRARGVVTDPDSIVVCSGYKHALFLLGKAFRACGWREIAFENPSLHVMWRQPTDAGLAVVGVDVDDDGIVVDRIASPAVVVTPAHQYPLGCTLHPRRRAELVEMAERENIVVIEDDYDGEFRFDKQSVGALQSMSPQHVIYAGTASKTLSPALRLSWLALPDHWVDPIVEQNRNVALNAPTIDQLTLAEFIESGGYDQHVRRCRLVYRRRRDELLAMLAEHKNVSVQQGVSAGLHLVVRAVDGGPSERQMMNACARHSVAIEALRNHWVDGKPRFGGIVVGYAAPAEHSFGPALSALSAALDDTP